MNKHLPAILTVFLLLLGSGFSLGTMRPQTDTQVEIVQDGTVLYQFDLAQEENQILEVEYQGRVNYVEIHDRQIRVLEAECPDHTCVQMGWLGENGLPIVCLPNHLVIQFAQSSDGLDAVT